MGFGQQVRSYQGLITARHGPDIGPEADITYDAVAVNTTDVVRLTNHRPERPWRDVRIYAAQTNYPCTIVVVAGPGGDVRYLHVREELKLREACEP